VTLALLKQMRRKWDMKSQEPIVQLIRLFVDRVFHGSGESADGGLDLSMGLILSLLALPGGFYSVFLLEKYSTLLQWMHGRHYFDPLVAALPDEYFFIVLSMTVTGVVAVWRWDSIFPDRRDYLNLVHLPISMRKIFLANMTAILFLTVVLALDVNAVSAFLFPLVVSAFQGGFSFFAQFFWVHSFVVILASIFSFFAVFATVGILMVTLPYPAFRRISLYVRSAIIACLVAMLATSFVVPSALDELPRTLLRFLPSVWFLGLCQLIRGRASPPLVLLGWFALVGTIITTAAALVIYTLSYRRCFVRIPETVETAPAHRRTLLPWIFSILDGTILTSPFQRAGYRFAITTLLRSECHGLVLGGFLGLGVVTASQFLFAAFNSEKVEIGSFPPSEILAIPLILSYFIILGVRLVLDIPIEMRANWIFRICLDNTKRDCVPLARKLILTFVLPWVLAVALPLYGYLWGWWLGILQTVVVTFWSVLLTEILLLNFRKIPFTCSFPPFRDSAVLLVLFFVLGFFVFVVLTSQLEYWGLSNPALAASFIAVVLIVLYALSRFRRRKNDIETGLIFEENVPASFELIDLGHGT
jgi:hypothetical protein